MTRIPVSLYGLNEVVNKKVVLKQTEVKPFLERKKEERL